MACPHRRTGRKTLLTLVIVESEDCLLEGLVGYSGDQPSLLRHTEVGEDGVQFELRLGTGKSNVGRFAVDFAATAQGSGNEAEGVNCVALPAIVLADQDRQIFFKTDSLVFERSKVLEAQRFKKHG